MQFRSILVTVLWFFPHRFRWFDCKLKYISVGYMLNYPCTSSRHILYSSRFSHGLKGHPLCMNAHQYHMHKMEEVRGKKLNFHIKMSTYTMYHQLYFKCCILKLNKCAGAKNSLHLGCHLALGPSQLYDCCTRDFFVFYKVHL